jgi:hypothetical protein
MLFLMGVLAFLDSIFNYGEIFRQANSFLFMLISLGVLIRLRKERIDTLKTKSRSTEPLSTEEKKTESFRAEEKKVEVG